MSDFVEVRMLDIEVGDIVHERGKPYRVGKIVPGDNRETLTLFLDGYFGASITRSTLITKLIVKRHLLKRWYQEHGLLLATPEEVRWRLQEENADIVPGKRSFGQRYSGVIAGICFVGGSLLGALISGSWLY